MAKVSLKIQIDSELASDLEQILLERNLSLDEAVGLYLRSMIYSASSGRALLMESKMPFGKYRGELVGTIAKAEPNYLKFLLGSKNPINLSPEVLEFLK